MSTVEFRSKLGEQLQILEESCRVYDRGKKEEALRIAVPLKVIFQGGGGPSTLAGSTNATLLKLLSTCIESPGAATYWTGQIQWDLDAQNSVFRALPLLGTTKRTHREVNRGTWWEGEVVCKNAHQRIRRDFLIKAAASLAAGTHLDYALLAQFRWVLDGSPWKMTQKQASGPDRIIHVYDAHLATLRQIGFEVLNSPGLTALAAQA